VGSLCAGRLVHGRLKSTVVNTPLRNGAELVLPALAPDLQLLAERVLSGRMFAGDAAFRRELGAWTFDVDVACPFGCRDNGRAVPLTWWHALFFCPGKKDGLSDMRARWCVQCDDAESPMSSNAKSGCVAHGQLVWVRELIEKGVQWRKGGRHLEGSHEELRLARKFMGGLVDGNVDGEAGWWGTRVACSKSAKAAAHSVLVGGLEVLAEALGMVGNFNASARQAAKQRKQRWLVIEAWRGVVIDAGPRKMALLGALGDAGMITWEMARTVVVVGGGEGMAVRLLRQVQHCRRQTDVSMATDSPHYATGGGGIGCCGGVTV